MYPFGHDLTVWHFPLVDNEPPVLSAAMQAQNPTIYLFPDRPSRAAAADGTGAIGSAIISWTWDTSKNGAYFTVPAIDDPYPTSEDENADYWLGINYRLTASEQVQTFIQHLPLVRARGVAREANVTENTLRGIFSGVVNYGTSPDRIAAIVEAKRLLKAHLSNRGFEWCQVTNLQDVEGAISYKALAIICLGQQQQPGDKFFVKYQEYSRIAQSLFDSLKLEYDSDKDNKPDSSTTSGGGTMYVSR